MTGDEGRKNKNPMHEAREALDRHPRCGAHCRTTGEPCRNPAMKNGRCRMHGGKSTGRPVTHGRTTRAWRQKYAKAREMLEGLKNILDSYSL